jgi:4-hydroxybenzoyl-CoA thioesterase
MQSSLLTLANLLGSLGSHTKMHVSRKKILVEWGDCDPADIVFYPRYLEWFDDCMTELFKSAGMPIQETFKKFDAVGFPIVDVKARFLLPSSFGDELHAETTVTEFRRSSFVIRHQFFKGGVLAVEGFETRVWTGHDSKNPSIMKSQPLPREVVEKLSKK